MCIRCSKKGCEFMEADKLLHQLKRMDKAKRDEMLDSLDKALSDGQKQKLAGMVKNKQLDTLISGLLQSEEVQKKISEMLG